MQELVDITQVMRNMTQAWQHAGASAGHGHPATVEALKKSVYLAISTADGYAVAAVGLEGNVVPSVETSQALVDFYMMRRSVLEIVEPIVEEEPVKVEDGEDESGS